MPVRLGREDLQLVSKVITQIIYCDIPARPSYSAAIFSEKHPWSVLPLPSPDLCAYFAWASQRFEVWYRHCVPHQLCVSDPLWRVNGCQQPKVFIVPSDTPQESVQEILSRNRRSGEAGRSRASGRAESPWRMSTTATGGPHRSHDSTCSLYTVWLVLAKQYNGELVECSKDLSSGSVSFMLTIMRHVL